MMYLWIITALMLGLWALGVYTRLKHKSLTFQNIQQYSGYVIKTEWPCEVRLDLKEFNPYFDRMAACPGERNFGADSDMVARAAKYKGEVVHIWVYCGCIIYLVKRGEFWPSPDTLWDAVEAWRKGVG